MKIERDKAKGFIPITIVLETEEEAEALYAQLHLTTDENIEEYCKRHKLDWKIRQVEFDIWEAFDEVYQPSWRKGDC